MGKNWTVRYGTAAILFIIIGFCRIIKTEIIYFNCVLFFLCEICDGITLMAITVGIFSYLIYRFAGLGMTRSKYNFMNVGTVVLASVVICEIINESTKLMTEETKLKTLKWSNNFVNGMLVVLGGVLLVLELDGNKNCEKKVRFKLPKGEQEEKDDRDEAQKRLFEKEVLFSKLRIILKGKKNLQEKKHLFQGILKDFVVSKGSRKIFLGIISIFVEIPFWVTNWEEQEISGRRVVWIVLGFVAAVPFVVKIRNSRLHFPLAWGMSVSLAIQAFGLLISTLETFWISNLSFFLMIFSNFVCIAVFWMWLVEEGEREIMKRKEKAVEMAVIACSVACIGSMAGLGLYAGMKVWGDVWSRIGLAVIELAGCLLCWLQRKIQLAEETRAL